MGRETLGRIMNVIGEPVDECGPISELGQPCGKAVCTSVHIPFPSLGSIHFATFSMLQQQGALQKNLICLPACLHACMLD